MKFLILLAVFIGASDSVEDPKNAVHNFTKKMAEWMFDCADVMYPRLDFTEKILDFWKRDYDVQNINLGCLAMCSMLRLKLLDGNGELLQLNMRGFLKANGADERLVSSIIDIYHRCRTATASIKKTCTKGLELMKCFRENIFQLQWVPEVQFGPYD